MEDYPEDAVNKKRKCATDESDDSVSSDDDTLAVDLDDPFSVLHRLVCMQDESAPEPPLDVSARRQRIIQANNDLEELYQLEEAMQACLVRTRQAIAKKKTAEIDSLYDSFSPLLSLGSPCLSKILGYLDEDALFRAEKASWTLGLIALGHGHWKCLCDLAEEKYNHKDRGLTDFVSKDNLRYRDDCLGPLIRTYGRYTNSLPTEEGSNIPLVRYLGDLAGKARKLEVAGEKYYDYKSKSSNSKHTDSGMELNIRSKVNPKYKATRAPGSFRDPRPLYRKVTHGLKGNIWYVRISRARGTPGCGDPISLWQGNCLISWSHLYLWRKDNNNYDCSLNAMSTDFSFLLEKAREGWPELSSFADWCKSSNASEVNGDLVQEKARVAFGGIRVSVVMKDKHLLSTGGFQRAKTNDEGGQDICFQSRYEEEKESYQPAHTICVETCFSLKGDSLKLHVKASLKGADKYIGGSEKNLLDDRIESYQRFW